MEVKKLMEAALRMKRENQTDHPRYAQIITVLKQYQQQQQQERVQQINRQQNESVRTSSNISAPPKNNMNDIQNGKVVKWTIFDCISNV
jgi:inorganic pyrophosphatase/exopolyphosphatase